MISIESQPEVVRQIVSMRLHSDLAWRRKFEVGGWEDGKDERKSFCAAIISAVLASLCR